MILNRVSSGVSFMGSLPERQVGDWSTDFQGIVGMPERVFRLRQSEGFAEHGRLDPPVLLADGHVATPAVTQKIIPKLKATPLRPPELLGRRRHTIGANACGRHPPGTARRLVPLAPLWR
jgi:hypothetical protein